MNKLDFKDLIRQGFDEYLDDLKSALDGLSGDERRFRVSAQSNHVDFIVWHMARVEDDFVQRFAQSARRRCGSATAGTSGSVCRSAKLAAMDGRPMPESYTKGQPIAQLQGRELQVHGAAARVPNLRAIRPKPLFPISKHGRDRR